MRDHLPAWINLHHLAVGQSYAGTVALHKKPRWPETAGDAHVRLELEIIQASSGRMALKGQIRGEVELDCQRCLSPATCPVEGQFLLELVESEAQAQRVGSEVDVYIAEEQKVQVHDLLLDETLLILPMMPKHDDGACQAPDWAED